MKEYKKPEIHIETFTLTEHIAYGCSPSAIIDVTATDSTTCAFTLEEDYGGMVVFVDSNVICDSKADDGYYYECYELFNNDVDGYVHPFTS